MTMQTRIRRQRTDAPLVVVVTPVYNGGRYLKRAMESVQAQTYPNLVHIVLDNASTDATPDIIASFADARIPVLRYRNGETLPLQANWNRAFSFLPENAAYANLLCADDLLHAEAIERFVEYAERDEAIQAVFSDGVFADTIRRPKLPAREAAYDGRLIARTIMCGDIGWVPFHHFFVRLSPDMLGEAFCGFDWSQDPYVFMRSALKGKVGYIPEPLVYSRYHAESVTGKAVSTNAVQPHMVGLSLLRHFGAAAFDVGERKRAMSLYRRNMARQQLVYRLTRRSSGADALRRALAEQGVSCTSWHYLRSVVSLASNRIGRLRSSPVEPAMNEDSFLAQSARRSLAAA